MILNTYHCEGLGLSHVTEFDSIHKSHECGLLASGTGGACEPDV